MKALGCSFGLQRAGGRDANRLEKKENKARKHLFSKIDWRNLRSLSKRKKWRSQSGGGKA